MDVDSVAIPMRAQPFHWGHKRLLRRIHELYNLGVVFLHRETDPVDNPFSFEVRCQWVRTFLQQEGLCRIIVADRFCVDGSGKYDEYSSFFPGRDFVVLTTPENDERYRLLGFSTVNHHGGCLQSIWGPSENPANLSNHGRMIRERLREGRDCSELLDPEVYRDARSLFSGE